MNEKIWTYCLSLVIKTDCHSGAGVSTSRGEHKVDVVVLAAGLNTAELAKKLGAEIPLADKPGTLTILTQPMPHFLQHIVVTGTACFEDEHPG